MTNGQHNNPELNQTGNYERDLEPQQASVFIIASLDNTKPANKFNGNLLSKAFQSEAIQIDSLQRLRGGNLRVEVSHIPSRISLSHMTKFQNTEIKVSIPTSQNTRQGIVYSEEAVYVDSETEMWEFVKDQNPTVVKMKLLNQRSQQDKKRKPCRPRIRTMLGQSFTAKAYDVLPML